MKILQDFIATNLKWMRAHSQMLRATAAHIGIISGAITYVCIGAALFLYLERPTEIMSRQYHLITYEKIKLKFLRAVAADNLTGNDLYVLSTDYIEELFDFYKDSQAARTFEAHYLNHGMQDDQWTITSAILFTATTVIPVGYGFVTPITKIGRFIVIIYVLIGAPLVLITITDIGKFCSLYFLRILPESVAGLCFLGFLIVYLFFGALLFAIVAGITYLEAVYFSITSVFTIGYGDTQPPVPIPYLILYIVIGVIMLTITIEVLAAGAINHIHYMGRHVSRAKKFTQKFYQMARAMDLRRDLNIGLTQIESLVHLSLIFGVVKTDPSNEERAILTSCNINAPFTPANDDFRFVDDDVTERFFHVIAEQVGRENLL
uniref:Potassium channel domain-containing protein n=1 Tax=Onchocerca volvulus TaxID=6282 RepID=A0A8R1XLR6_ONCVO